MQPYGHEECSFCAEIAGACGADDYETSFNLYRTISGRVGAGSRIIWQNEDLLLMPTIGCFVEGYSLLITRRHYYSIAEFARNHDLSEFAQILSSIRKLMGSLYSGCIFFEHGAIDAHCKAGGCCDHAHLHILPAIGHALDRAKRQFSFTMYPDLEWVYQVSSPYLLFHDGENYYLSTDHVVPSQYFRKLLAREAGLGDRWDWRKYPFTDNMLHTFEKMRRQSVHYLARTG